MDRFSQFSPGKPETIIRFQIQYLKVYSSTLLEHCFHIITLLLKLFCKLYEKWYLDKHALDYPFKKILGNTPLLAKIQTFSL